MQSKSLVTNNFNCVDLNSILKHFIKPLCFFLEAPEARKTLLCSARSILQKIQDSIQQHVSIPGLLVYISQKSELLSDGEAYHLKRKDFSTKQKTLLLVNYIANRKKTPVERLYLCLLDSYNQPGMEGHYIVAQQLRDCGETSDSALVADGLYELGLCWSAVTLMLIVYVCILQVIHC